MSKHKPALIVEAYRLSDKHLLDRADQYKAERDEFENRCIKLESDRQKLVEALHRATNMRPALLMTHGSVPEAVLEYCNDVRVLLRELGE
jgi:hypothetical protein